LIPGALAPAKEARVRNASGISQGNLPVKTCFQP